jgi:hypothetical protein
MFSVRPTDFGAECAAKLATNEGTIRTADLSANTEPLCAAFDSSYLAA